MSSRLAYVEIHRHDRGDIAAGVLQRAATWMAEQGCGPVQAVMTDNALAYRRSRHFKAALEQLDARHILTAPRTPRWNGKAERFIRTLDEEWAHGRIWPSSTRRNRALASFLRYYNRRRSHTSLGDRPPISRLHQDRGQDSDDAHDPPHRRRNPVADRRIRLQPSRPPRRVRRNRPVPATTMSSENSRRETVGARGQAPVPEARHPWCWLAGSSSDYCARPGQDG
jgi:hypothetical protein